MKIGLFSDTFPPEINGVANSTSILFHELLSAGHDVYVVTTRKGRGFCEWDEDHRILRLSGMELKQLYGYVATTPFHFNALSEIKKLDLDVIHVQTEFGVGIFARMCAKQLGIPLVSTYHTTYEDYTHYANFINSHEVDIAAKKMVARLSKMYGDSCQEVIAPSDKTKELLLGYHLKTNIHVVPTGLPLDKFYPSAEGELVANQIRKEFGVQENEKLVVYVGRIAEEKALDLVIRGFAKSKEWNSTIKLLVVGSGPDLDKLISLSKELNCDDIVKFAGKKPSEEVPDFYHAGDAFISASTTETQGMTYIEALASGIPLFARRDEVLQDLLIEGKTGWYFEDEDDLSNVLKNLLNVDHAKKQEMKKDCLAQVQPYSSKVFMERALHVYEDAIHVYENMHEIEDVRVKNDAVLLYLINDAKEETKVIVSLDDYYNMGFRKGGKISSDVVELLRKKEVGVQAYEKCVRRIAQKDRTIKEMYDWLTMNTECDIETINTIIERLEEKGYLNDARYTEDSISRMKIALFGKQRIMKELKKRGIPYELIQEKLEMLPDDEYDNARKYANKIRLSLRDDSVRMKKNKIVQKMMVRGYSSDVSWDVVNQLDFSEDEMNELTSLRRCAAKAKRRYSRKYTSTELRNRVFRYCAAQGFNGEDIYVILDEMEWSD